MRIYYCEKCDTRLTEEDIASGQALIDASEHVFCVRCAPPALAKRATGPVSNGVNSRQSGARPNDLPTRSIRKTPGFNALPNVRNSGVHRAVSSSTRVAGSSIRATAPPPMAEATPRKKFPMKWAVLGGAVPLLALGAALYALGIFGKAPPKPPEIVAEVKKEPAPAENKSDGKTVAQAAPDTKPTEALGNTGRSMFDEMAKEHQRKFDPEQEKAVAVKRLEEAQEFFKTHPQDPWTYLEMLRLVQTGTPSGDAAGQTIIALNLPTDRTESPGWQRDWQFSPGTKPIQRYELDKRPNVLQTVPPGKDSEIVFNRTFKISADKAFLTFAARTDDKAACKIAVEVNGKLQLLEDLKGAGWTTFDLDLSALKGTDADVQIRHIVQGNSTPSVYWTPLVFRAAPDAAAKHLIFNSAAVAYAKPKGPQAPTKRPFVAPASWKESAAWKQPLELLASVDVKGGAVEGVWKRGDKNELISGNVKFARLALAQKLPEQYDIRATFERKGGNGDAGIILSRAGKPFIWMMGAENNKSFALAQVNGKNFEGNPAWVKSGCCLKNGQRYTTVIEVRKDRISAYLDGKLIVEWVPDMGELLLENAWKLPDGKMLGVAAYQSEIAFSSLELVEVK